VYSKNLILGGTDTINPIIRKRATDDETGEKSEDPKN
jgi:hypothetical protein